MTEVDEGAVVRPPMRGSALDALKWTWREWKRNSSPYVTAALESYLIAAVISLVSLLVFIPLFFGVMFLLINTSGSSGVIWIMILFFLFFLIFFLILLVIRSISGSGTLDVIARTFRGEKPRFGDVFRYGKRNYILFLPVIILSGIANLLLVLVAMSPVIGLFFLSATVLAEAACLGFLIIFPMALLVVIFVIAPFSIAPTLAMVCRYKNMDGNVSAFDCVSKGYSFVFKNYGFSLAMGFWIMLFSFLISMIPSVGQILLNIFKSPYLMTTMMHVYYERVLGQHASSEIRSFQQPVSGGVGSYGQDLYGRDIEVPVPDSPPPPGMKRCSKCGTLTDGTVTICPNCYGNLI